MLLAGAAESRAADDAGLGTSAPTKRLLTLGEFIGDLAVLGVETAEVTVMPLLLESIKKMLENMKKG